MTEEDKLRIALDEALRREHIAVQELQKMRQRAEKAEKELARNRKGLPPFNN